MPFLCRAREGCGQGAGFSPLCPSILGGEWAESSRMQNGSHEENISRSDNCGLHLAFIFI